MSRPAIAIVCPGQGSQHPGMLDRVPDEVGLERLLDAAEAMTDLDLRALDRHTDASELADTRTAQPLLYLTDWAWGKGLLEAGLDPVAIAGHSLGELAALALAGVFSVEAGLHLVAERSSLMSDAAGASSGAMAAVLGLSSSEVADVLASLGDVWLANDNCPGQIVISGVTEAVDDASAALTDAGARRVVPLAVSGAFHSPLMEDAAKAFASILEEAEFSDAVIPVVQNAAPETAVTDAGSIRSNLAVQMTSPVRWTETVDTLRGLGAGLLVEAGPGSVLTGLARRIEGVEALAIEDAGIGSVIEEASA